ncbi:twin-arginine translocation signal domain-containing protein, partial [Candidatus Amesbacteria bacterium]|nr:twin-arginine translocation signal domain-containing protein [Candidatus Amesbacteria bacterium]
MEDSERKKVTRRGFLKLAAAAIAGVGLAYVGAPPKTAEAPGGVAADPEVKPKGEARVFSEGGVKVWEDQDGVPQRWADSKGNSGIFDKDELLKAKETANKESRFVVAAARVVNMTAGNEPVPTVTRAETTNLPEDIVSHEQLGQRGIELISGEKIGVYFRQSAFSEGGVLADYTEGGDRKLVIIVADNPTLTPFAFDDARYDKYREILMGRLAEPKPQTAGGIREMMAANFSNSVLPNGEFLGRVWEGMPDREIIEEGLYPGTDGYYVPNGFEGGLPDKSVLMVALGGRPEKSYDVVRVDVGPAGEFSYFLEKVGSKD